MPTAARRTEVLRFIACGCVSLWDTGEAAAYRGQRCGLHAETVASDETAEQAAGLRSLCLGHQTAPAVADQGCGAAVFRCTAAVCEDMGCTCLAIGGMEDHVHLLVALCSTVTLGQLMKAIKGATAHMISDEIKPGDWFAWQPNYAAFAVSPSHVPRVVRYIVNQQEHHAHNTLWPAAEETNESSLTDDQ